MVAVAAGGGFFLHLEMMGADIMPNRELTSLPNRESDPRYAVSRKDGCGSEIRSNKVNDARIRQAPQQSKITLETQRKQEKQ